MPSITIRPSNAGVRPLGARIGRSTGPFPEAAAMSLPDDHVAGLGRDTALVAVEHLVR